MPRSGKSYEAMVKHIIPNVLKGRKVFAYIEGINHKKIAELTDKTEQEVQDLVIQITREDVVNIADVVEDNSFVVIDELQNFFPSGRQKLDEKMTQFVTEHGHRGLDILTMGQSLADCHNLWKRRTEVKMAFLKLSAVGKSNSYKWTNYRGQLTPDGNVKYTKIRSGVEKYDSKYFGSYSSHVSSDTNADDYIDDRSNIFKGNTFKYGIPIFIVVCGLAINYLVGFFNGDVEIANEEIIKASTNKNSKISKNKEPIFTKTYIDYFDELLTIHKSRLTGHVKYKHYTEYFIEVVDNTYHNIDRFTSSDISLLGWKSNYNRYGLVLSNGKTSHLIRYRSFDPFGSVNDTSNPELAN